MDRLPDELILSILSHLDLQTLITAQSLNHRFLNLSRDNSTWRTECFNRSRAGAALAQHEARTRSERRRRSSSSRPSEPRGSASSASQAQIQTQQSESSISSDAPSALSRLREAITSLAASGSDPGCHDAAAAAAAGHQAKSPQGAKQRAAAALANWDPGYTSSSEERIDFYEAYKHRHAPIAPTAYLDAAPEVLGMDVLRDPDGVVEAVVAPLEDGSLRIWDMVVGATGQHSGCVIGCSRPGLLPASRDSVSAPVECVSVHRASQTGFFAIDERIHQVDLRTLQPISTKAYPLTITALSSTSDSDPLTIGTTSSLHLYDPREPHGSSPSSDPAGRTSSTTPSGPTSILHVPSVCSNQAEPSSSHQIWTAGRYKALMIHDRRNFPALLSVQFSGAQISSLARLPYLHRAAMPDLFVHDPNATISRLETIKARRGQSVLACGEYGGKGSLEIYSSVEAMDKDEPQQNVLSAYKNRQTVSSSAGLSASPHGAALVVADGNGALKWFERDGFTPIRTHDLVSSDPDRAHHARLDDQQQQQQQRQGTLFREQTDGDVVWKILETRSATNGLHSAVGERNDLLLWTGDGRIGVLGFGYSSPLSNSQSPVVETWDAEEDARIQFERKMSRLLLSQADEMRFLSRLGCIGA